ncbi:MAG TPA: ankyrin repeat domain-containing protein, partial [Steroidobacteraceae bacterium]|nr:ankyrin repeat domain-containing protein [Steroidobacteraceae bacterium]
MRVKEFERAQAELERLAAAGNAEAQYSLACFHLTGLARSTDLAQARAWLEKAAGQGHAAAAYSLAALLTATDRAAAERWLARARELGSPAAQQALGRKALPLEFLPDVDLADAQSRRDALWLAAEQGNMGSLQALAEPRSVNLRDEFGRGALARAALAGQAEATALLVQRGANVSAPDQFGITPLMLAAQSENPAV